MLEGDFLVVLGFRLFLFLGFLGFVLFLTAFVAFGFLLGALFLFALYFVGRIQQGSNGFGGFRLRFRLAFDGRLGVSSGK
jgi:hypothetical protein